MRKPYSNNPQLQTDCGVSSLACIDVLCTPAGITLLSDEGDHWDMEPETSGGEGGMGECQASPAFLWLLTAP